MLTAFGIWLGALVSIVIVGGAAWKTLSALVRLVDATERNTLALERQTEMLDSHETRIDRQEVRLDDHERRIGGLEIPRGRELDRHVS